MKDAKGHGSNARGITNANMLPMFGVKATRQATQERIALRSRRDQGRFGPTVVGRTMATAGGPSMNVPRETALAPHQMSLHLATKGKSL